MLEITLRNDVMSITKGENSIALSDSQAIGDFCYHARLGSVRWEEMVFDPPLLLMEEALVEKAWAMAIAFSNDQKNSFEVSKA